MLRSNDDEIWANLSSICCVEDYNHGSLARTGSTNNGTQFGFNGMVSIFRTNTLLKYFFDQYIHLPESVPTA